MEECKKPIINFLYFPWDMQSLRWGKVFQKMIKDLEEEGLAEKFTFATLDGYHAYARHKLTRLEIMNVGGGCRAKENQKFFAKHRDVGINSDIQISLKIDRNFPAFIGMVKSKVLKIIRSDETDESDIMEQFQPVIDELKSKILFF